jgi:hypothetical protein
MTCRYVGGKYMHFMTANTRRDPTCYPGSTLPGQPGVNLTDEGSYPIDGAR